MQTIRLVGAAVNGRGDEYNIWQSVDDGIVYWAVTKPGERGPTSCSYRDLAYLLKLKGF